MTVPLHALTVHFAVAFTVLWFFFEIIARYSAREHFRMMADWMLGLATVAVGSAVVTGMRAEAHADPLKFVPAHEVLGFTIFGGMVFMGILRAFALKKEKPAFHVIYLVLGLLIMVTLYRSVNIGSQMVYMRGVGIGSAYEHEGNDSSAIRVSHANYFICPGCDIVRAVAGKCPKCGRSLVPVGLATSTTPASEELPDSLGVKHLQTAH